MGISSLMWRSSLTCTVATVVEQLSQHCVSVPGRCVQYVVVFLSLFIELQLPACLDVFNNPDKRKVFKPELPTPQL